MVWNILNRDVRKVNFPRMSCRSNDLCKMAVGRIVLCDK